MKKRFWKDRAKEFEARALTAETRMRNLQGEIRELRREVEDKRKNWTPIKIAHPYVPRDSGCQFCDDPQGDPRHQQGGAA
jgi:hypothetical protein